MTFESLAIAGLSVGLSMTDVYEMNVGLILGLLNEKNNQMSDLNKKEKDDEVVIGDAEMLKKM